MLKEPYNQIFEPGLIREIETVSKRVSLKEGDVILEIGQPIRIIPLILSGTIKVSRMDESGREILLYYVNSSESCAMTFTCCMEHMNSEIRAVAEDDVEMLSIPVKVMDDWIIKYPSWKNFIMKTMHTRFNELLRAIDQIAFQKLDDRLISYLKEKAKAKNSTLINLSHEQIASELATSRVVISRLLKNLENDRKVLLYRNQIKVLPDL